MSEETESGMTKKESIILAEMDIIPIHSISMGDDDSRVAICSTSQFTVILHTEKSILTVYKMFNKIANSLSLNNTVGLLKYDKSDLESYKVKEIDLSENAETHHED